jgi:hypothetical protein
MYIFLRGAMATSKKKTDLPRHISKSVKTKKVIVMRKNQKVARVSLCCKLNMLVPQLQSLTARMQSEAADKKRNSYNGNL